MLIWVHLLCLVKYANSKTEYSSIESWKNCTSCLQSYHGRLVYDLVNVYLLFLDKDISRG